MCLNPAYPDHGMVYGKINILKVISGYHIPLMFSKPITISYVQIAEVDQIIGSFNRFTVANNLMAGQFLLTVVLIFIGFGTSIHDLCFHVQGCRSFSLWSF